MVSTLPGRTYLEPKSALCLNNSGLDLRCSATTQNPEDSQDYFTKTRGITGTEEG